MRGRRDVDANDASVRGACLTRLAPAFRAVVAGTAAHALLHRSRRGDHRLGNRGCDGGLQPRLRHTPPPIPLSRRGPPGAGVHRGAERAGGREKRLAARYRRLQPAFEPAGEHRRLHGLQLPDRGRRPGGGRRHRAAEPGSHARGGRAAGPGPALHRRGGSQGRTGEQGAARPWAVATSFCRCARRAGEDDPAAHGRVRGGRGDARGIRVPGPGDAVAHDGGLVRAGAGELSREAA